MSDCAIRYPQIKWHFRWVTAAKQHSGIMPVGTTQTSEQVLRIWQAFKQPPHTEHGGKQADLPGHHMYPTQRCKSVRVIFHVDIKWKAS